MATTGSGPEHFTPEHCYITELFNTAADPSCSIARARVLPGVTTQRHALRGIAERYVILSGSGRVNVGGDVKDVVSPGVVSIAAGTPQNITNTGGTDLIFLCICTPRFTPNAYENLEAAASPGSCGGTIGRSRPERTR